jgi:hypothetical protein
VNPFRRHPYYLINLIGGLFVAGMLHSNRAACQEELFRIPTTRVSVCIPGGFTHQYGTAYFINDREGFHVIEGVGENYHDSLPQFTDAYFKSMGVQVKERMNFVVDDYPATLVTGTMMYREPFFWLAFGDSSFTVCISGSVDLGNQARRTDFLACLLLTEYDAGMKLEPYEDIDFKIDSTSNNYRLATVKNGFFWYTPGGVPFTPLLHGARIGVAYTYNHTQASMAVCYEAYIIGLRNGGLYGVMSDSTFTDQRLGCDELIDYGRCYIDSKRYYYIVRIIQRDYIPLVINAFCPQSEKENYANAIKFCMGVEY